MKKLLFYFILLTCSSIVIGQEKFKVGFCMDDSIATRWRSEHAILKSGINDAGGELMVKLSEGDSYKQFVQAKQLIEDGAKILIVVPVDAEGSAEIVDYAKERGVKTIAYSRLIRNGQLDYYLSYDIKDIGVQQAKYAVSKMPKGNYVLMGGPLKDHSTTVIEEGQLEVLKPYIDKGDINLIYNDHLKEWTDLEAYFEASTILSGTDKSVDVLIAGNDVIAEGALRSFKLEGQSPVVIGMDAELNACKRIVNDEQSMSIYLPGKDLAFTAAKLVMAIQKDDQKAIKEIVNSTVNNGKYDVPAGLLGSVVISKENLKEALTEYGIHEVSSVFK